MAQFVIHDVEVNATATVVVLADSLEEAKERFAEGDYELFDTRTDGIADSGINETAADRMFEGNP